jgi:hypothetical protein
MKTAQLTVDSCEQYFEQRADDTIETIKERFSQYDNETKPLAEFFQSNGLLKRFQVKKGIADAPALQALMTEKELDGLFLVSIYLYVLISAKFGSGCKYVNLSGNGVIICNHSIIIS